MASKTPSKPLAESFPHLAEHGGRNEMKKSMVIM
jgi:hypothetical protein